MLFFGFLVSVISFFILAGVLFYKLLGYPLPGWTAIMAAILFLGGTILFTIGVLGIYMAAIYNEVKGRPKFVIQEKIGLD
jgi:dolichol-phosphate mannosyltransferase